MSNALKTTAYNYTYKYQNPRLDEKEIKVLSTHVHLILISKNCYEEKMICNHTIFRDIVKNRNSSEVGADWSLRT